MRRILYIALCFLLTVSTLTACEKKTAQRKDNDKISIVATIFPPYDFARAIAGDKAEITMLLPPGSETHSFEPTPQDIIKIQNCDVFIYIGGESDEWVKNVLNSMDISSMKIVTLTNCVELVEEVVTEGMQGEEEEHDEDKEGHEEHEYDEHVWTSPRNAKLIVQKISDVLCEVDTANASVYKQNTTDYSSKLDRLDSDFKAVAENAARKTIVFGDRFPFRYFADAYGLKYFAAFPGCSGETEASAKTVKFLIDKINAEKIPVVFHIELGNERMAAMISESTDAKVRTFHACHNLTKADFNAGKTYLDFMTANVETLKEALQ